MNAWLNSGLDRLELEYDADNDLIPGAPEVTHTDWVLLEAIRRLEKRLEEMERQMEVVNDALVRIEDAVPSAGRKW